MTKNVYLAFFFLTCFMRLSLQRSFANLNIEQCISETCSLGNKYAAGIEFQRPRTWTRKFSFISILTRQNSASFRWISASSNVFVLSERRVICFATGVAKLFFFENRWERWERRMITRSEKNMVIEAYDDARTKLMIGFARYKIFGVRISRLNLCFCCK
ncbi:hypothetical protein RCL_jg6136.t1 [Rhizophagus clarus]|uniref:Secreted protein n=1 Tax=Rhizophagus clarus TaxID=94130 RepID=A0A8H3QFN7_9GLOM|nr:hypothetical protein RCL_jg6136.t1 [Rhizophagus clarus]